MRGKLVLVSGFGLERGSVIRRGDEVQVRVRVRGEVGREYVDGEFGGGDQVECGGGAAQGTLRDGGQVL